MSVIRNNPQLVKYIEYTFVKRGIPKHLRNLAVIESGLDPSQVSTAGAKGVWQFMVGHANDFGLADDSRSDMYKSTQTVTNSLITLYNKYKNWITVVAAYNCGPGNVDKAINRAGSKYYTDFYQYLPAETINHVQKYLNACYATGEINDVLSDYNRFIPKKNTTSITKVKNDNAGLQSTFINAAYDLDLISKALKITRAELDAWNPSLENNLAEIGESIMYLPNDLMIDFIINKSGILSDSLKN